MDASYAIYSLAVAWFTYTVFRMSVLLYQFMTFPKTYGSMPRFSLHDLLDMSVSTQTDLPSFNVVVPAFNEVEVIEGTIRRLAKINYPHTHFRVSVVTYEDEPAIEGQPSTTDVVRRVAKIVNKEFGHELVRSIVVPTGFDGFFPGNLDAEKRHIGKSRGLNYALRNIHAENERCERAFFIGKMIGKGLYDQQNKIITGVIKEENKSNLSVTVSKYFHRDSIHYIGSLVFSSQLKELVGYLNELSGGKHGDKKIEELLREYLEAMAEQFYFKLNKKSDSRGIRYVLVENEQKKFLYDVVVQVESENTEAHVQYANELESTLKKKSPYLFQKIQRSRNAESLYHASRMIKSRWMMVYDADADAPSDLMRYLAARILSSTEIMGFQGPVAPVLNYEEVHPICKLGGLWMAFWHAASYPRLMNNPEWAHPLAGTNWCFCIEGMEHEGTLVRDIPYDEGKRRFLLNFNPKQLTEDLEAGIRFYSDWSVNAEWHPVLELEQVPPTPDALVVQRTRWTLGTLQTIRYIMHSRVPVLQKLRFMFHPVEIMVNGSGPVITILLFTALLSGLIVVDPIFAWWAVILTFGNLIYIICFVKVFERYYDIKVRISRMDFVYKKTSEIVDKLKKGNYTISNELSGKLLKLIELMEKSTQKNGFAEAYYNWRCTDNKRIVLDKNSHIGEYEKWIETNTPTKISSEDMHIFALELKNILSVNTNPHSNEIEMSEYMELPSDVDELIEVMTSGEKFEKSRGIFRWSKFHKEIVLWTFPYIFYQLIPYFKGLFKWILGGTEGWHKTTRTPKHRPGSIK